MQIEKQSLIEWFVERVEKFRFSVKKG